MNISIVIPNFNGAHLLQKNFPKLIEEIKRSTYLHVTEIVIVDDASKDDSVDVIKTFIEKYTHVTITLLQNNRNYGFSSTINKGVGKTSGDIIVLLNTDVHPEKDFLKSALPHFKDADVFAVGFLDRSIEGKNIVKRGRGIGYWSQGFVLHKRGEVDRQDTFWVSCGSSAFRKSMWNRLSGLDEVYNPFYWEDIDLSYRAQKAGYKILFEPNSVVIHEHEEGAIKSNFSKRQVLVTAYRNQFYFVWKNITDSRLLFSHYFYLPTHIFHALLRSDGNFFMGLIKALLHLPEIVRKRNKQKKYYKKGDRELLSIHS